MASEPSPPSSFSARRRWGIFFSVLISIVAVIALVAIANYLGTHYYTRLNWNHDMQIKLSPQTRFLLKSVTNEVKVVVYFDREDKLYSYVAGWLDEFHLANPKISVQMVDYPRQPGLAQQIKTTYKLSMTEDKNLVIFDCEGRRKKVYAASLGEYNYEVVPNAKEREFTTHLLAFEGEKQFSSALLSVMNPKPRKAYFLEGHGEASVESTTEEGYQKFAKILQDSDVTNAVLKLSGTNPIPADCNLLIIAGPTKAFPHDDLVKIKQYLDQGGRLFALFRYPTWDKETGLEAILTDWNIGVGLNYLDDPENTQPGGGLTVISSFNNNHPLSSQMLASQSAIAMLHPRSIAALGLKQGPETPKVTELAYTGTKVNIALPSNKSLRPLGAQAPVMAAVEKGSMKGVFPQRGTTAILAVGDSEFLNNKELTDFPDNGDFAGFAVNWLLDQTLMLEGVGAHAVKEYKLTMTESQLNSVRWLFVGIVPGTILAIGVLVWFRRRH